MTDSPAAAIKVEGLAKRYRIYADPSDRLRELITRKTRHETFSALADISFSIGRGECVGIIGPNGAGKSTLLKMIAGTLAPSSGEMRIAGKISAILELGTGFHPEYSGRDNVFLGGLCLGMSQAEVAAKFDWIVDFSELREVIDKPFKTYSSGMQARLTFATAISIEPDILIIDEALAAGDSYFVVKCGRRIRQICDSGATVLLVSHSTHQVATLCSRAIWIEDGRLRESGPALEVCRRYDYSVHERLSGQNGRAADGRDAVDGMADEVDAHAPAMAEASGAPSAQKRSFSNPAAPAATRTVVGASVLHEDVFRKGPVTIERIEFLSAGRPALMLRTFDPLTIRVTYACPDPSALGETLGLALGITRKRDNLLVAQFSTASVSRDEEITGFEHAPFRIPAGRTGVLEADFSRLQLMEGDYVFSLGVLPNIPGVVEFYEYHHMRFEISILRSGYPSGAIFYPDVIWRHSNPDSLTAS